LGQQANTWLEGIMALMFGVCAAIGALLGLRFKVTVLAPSIVMVAFSSAVIDAALGANSWAIVGTIVVSVIALQLGYLIGVIAYPKSVQYHAA
jgi:hypothetical protein